MGGVEWKQKLSSKSWLTSGLSWHPKGLMWNWSWGDPDLVLNFPVRIAWKAWNPWWASLEAGVMGVVSYVVQEVVQRVVPPSSDIPAPRETKRTRDEALQQQELMRTRSENRKRDEEKNGGLVVEKALYGVEGGEYLDVTIPIQFWVGDSSLMLPGVSKKGMLGFYDMTVEKKLDPRPIAYCEWVERFWRKAETKDSDNLVHPRLWIRYKWKGATYEATFNDKDEVKIPEGLIEV